MKWETREEDSFLTSVILQITAISYPSDLSLDMRVFSPRSVQSPPFSDDWLVARQQVSNYPLPFISVGLKAKQSKVAKKRNRKWKTGKKNLATSSNDHSIEQKKFEARSAIKWLSLEATPLFASLFPDLRQKDRPTTHAVVRQSEAHQSSPQITARKRERAWRKFEFNWNYAIFTNNNNTFHYCTSALLRLDERYSFHTAFIRQLFSIFFNLRFFINFFFVFLVRQIG